MQRVKVVKSKKAARREAELRRELRKILEKLRRDKSVKLVLLFGSLARGDVSESSDIDLIVVKDTKKRFLDRLDELYKDIGVAADILVYTPEEFEKMKKSLSLRKPLKRGLFCMKPDPIKEGMRWLLQAEQDLDDAKFLAQQAAEKALKAFSMRMVRLEFLGILWQSSAGEL